MWLLFDGTANKVEYMMLSCCIQRDLHFRRKDKVFSAVTVFCMVLDVKNALLLFIRFVHKCKHVHRHIPGAPKKYPLQNFVFFQEQ